MTTCLCDYLGMGLNFLDVDWVYGFLGVLLERHLITTISNWNSSNDAGRSLSTKEIHMCLCDYVLIWGDLLLSIALGCE